MSAAVVRVGAAPASTGARAPLKSFAVVDAVAAAQVAVESRGARTRELANGASDAPLSTRPSD